MQNMIKSKKLFDGNKHKYSMSNYVNNITYYNYLMRLSLLAKTMFEWEGIPDTCNEKYLEESLFKFGRAIFFHDETYGYMNLRGDPCSNYNVYGEPTRVLASGENGFHRDLTNKKHVIIRNNDYEIPTFNTIDLYAYRLYEVERSADINIKNQKFPLVILMNENQKLTFKNIYNKIDGNEPVIFGDKSLDLEGIKALKTDVPFVADKLLEYKHDIWNECMNFLGINNANMDKKERLITDEVNANNEQIMLSAQTMLKAREQACKEINKMFPELKISVKLRNLNKEEYCLDHGKEGDGLNE